jgi:Flp pilus assembly protein TadG
MVNRTRSTGSSIPNKNKGARSARGHHLIEFGPILWIVFIMLLFPLVCFGTLGMRYVFLSYVARIAVSAGAQSNSFLTDTNPPSQRSAVDTAGQVAVMAMNTFPGLQLSNITCSIVTSPLAGGAASRQTTPLSQPANTAANAYDFEVVLQAQMSPLVPCPSKFFAQVPGLNAPITTSVRADAFFENTQGLTQ